MSFYDIIVKRKITLVSLQAYPLCLHKIQHKKYACMVLTRIEV